MTKSNVGCRLLSWDEQHFKMNDSQLDEPSDAIKSVNRLQELWNLANPTIRDNLAQSSNIETAFERMRRVGGIVEAASRDDGFYSRLESGFINSVFGNIKAKVDGTTGSIKEYITDLDRQGKSYILTQFERLEIGQKAKVLQTETNKVFDRLGIKGADRAVVMQKLTENSNIPYLIDYNLGIGSPAQVLISKRQASTMEYLGKLGMTDADIEHLSSVASSLVQAQHEVISVGKSVNMDVNKILNSNYLPRVLTPEAQNVLNMVVNPEDRALLEKFTTNPGKWLRQSSESSHLLPNDIEAIDDLFTRGGIFTRINAATDDTLKQIMKDRGIKEITSINQMLASGDEPFIIDKFINKLKPDELDFMVDMGLVSKLPLDTGKMFDELLSHYKLPFDGLDDIFKYDPVEANRVYAESLSKLAGNESKTWGLLDGAINQFGIPKGEILNSPEYKSYLPLSRAFPDRVLNQIKDESLLQRLETTYIHPKVAQIANASYEMYTNPQRLGAIGDLLVLIKKTSAGMMLGTPQRFGREMLQRIPYLESYGIHPDSFLKYVGAKIWHDSKSMIEGTVSNFSEALTHEKIWANNTVSPKEMYLFASEKGLINNFSMFGQSSKSLDPNSFRRTLREMNWMKDNYPEHFNADYILGKGIKGSDQVIDSTLFKYTGYIETVNDNAAKMAMLEQVMNSHRVEKIIGNGFFDTIPYISDPSKAVAWVKDHSFMFDDVPYGSPMFQTFSAVVPFLGYQMKAFQQTGRYLVEHPHRFSAYLKLIGTVNDNFKNDYPEEKSIMQTPWTNQFTPSIPIRIPKEMSGTGSDEFFNFSLSNLVSQFGSTESINMLMDDMGLFNSSKIPSDRNDNPYSPNKISKLRGIFEDLASPPAKMLLAALSGQTGYGQDISSMDSSAKQRTLFGLPVSQQQYYWYSNIFPNIKSWDKMFSYTGLGGAAPKYDVTTGNYTPGKASVFGATPDYETAAQKPNIFGMYTPLTELLGLNPEHIDVYYKLGYEKKSSLEYQIKQAYDEAKQLKYKLANAHDMTDANNQLKVYQSHMLYAWYLDTEWAIVNKWAEQHNISAPKAIKRIMQADLQIDQLLSKEQTDEIARRNYQKWDKNPYVR